MRVAASPVAQAPGVWVFRFATARPSGRGAPRVGAGVTVISASPVVCLAAVDDGSTRTSSAALRSNGTLTRLEVALPPGHAVRASDVDALVAAGARLADDVEIPVPIDVRSEHRHRSVGVGGHRSARRRRLCLRRRMAGG